MLAPGSVFTSPVPPGWPCLPQRGDLSDFPKDRLSEPPGPTEILLPARRWMAWLPNSLKIGSACCRRQAERLLSTQPRGPSGEAETPHQPHHPPPAVGCQAAARSQLPGPSGGRAGYRDWQGHPGAPLLPLFPPSPPRWQSCRHLVALWGTAPV